CIEDIFLPRRRCCSLALRGDDFIATGVLCGNPRVELLALAFPFLNVVFARRGIPNFPHTFGRHLSRREACIDGFQIVGGDVLDLAVSALLLVIHGDPTNSRFASRQRRAHRAAPTKSASAFSTRPNRSATAK